MKNHEHLQLKHPKLRVGGCTEEVLEWFNYPSPSAHPRCEVSCQRVWNKQASSLCLRFVEARTMAKCCIVLESILTNSLVSKLLHCCLHCANFVPQARNTANNTTDGCVRNFSARSAWTAEGLQRCTWRYANLLLIKYSRVGGYTKDLNKGGWAFAWDNKV